jgi:hypothetical protein
MEEALLFAVKIDQTDAIKQTTELTKSIQELTAVQKELDATGQKNTEIYSENAAILRSLKKEQSDVNRQIDNSVKAFNAANGSINQQRANLSLLTQSYNNLSKEERENENVGGKLQKQIKQLSDELKKNESAIGDNRRSVGNYSGGILDATKQLKIFGVDVGGLVDRLKSTKDSIDTAKTGFAGFNGVLKASVIGVVIFLLTGLIAAFTKFEPIADKVTAIFAGMNAAIDVLTERLTRVGQGLIKIAQGNYAEGIDQIRTSFDGVAKSIIESSKAAFDLSEQLDALGDRQLAQITLNAEAKKSVDQLLLQAKNRTLSERERLKLLDQAGKIERANFEQNKAIQKEELRIAFEKAAIATRLNQEEIKELLTNTERREELEKRMGKLDSKILKDLAEKQAAIIGLESETINVEEKIQNRRDALLQQAAADREKAQAARQKAAEELQAFYEKAFADFDKAIKDQEDKVLSDREAAFQRQLTAQENFYKQLEIQRLNALTAGQITEQEYADQKLVAQANQQAALIELNQQFYKSTIDGELALAQTTLQINQKKKSDIEAANKAQAQSYIDLAQTAQNGISALAATFAEGSDLQRVAALTNVGLNLGTALGNIVATSTAPSPDNLATGGIAGVVKYGALLAQVLAAFSQVSSIIGGAAAGGGTFYTKGPTMLMVGDNPNGREKVTVEPIGTRGKTSISRNSNLVKMAGGGQLITDGGASMAAVTSQVNSMFDMERVLRRLPTPIVKVTDINRVNNNLKQSVKVSELSK